MKLKQYTSGDKVNKIAELSLENIGVNKFRVSLPLSQGTTGAAYSRVATIEASSEKTKAGVVRIMLKCTIPYLPQVKDDNGVAQIDTQKSARDFSFHTVWSVPSVMANDMLDPSMSAQAAQVIALAVALFGVSGVNLQILPPEGGQTQDKILAPVQAGPLSVDGAQAFPLDPTVIIPTAGTYRAQNISVDYLRKTIVGRVVSGLSPIDVNRDIDQVLSAEYQGDAS